MRAPYGVKVPNYSYSNFVSGNTHTFTPTQNNLTNGEYGGMDIMTISIMQSADVSPVVSTTVTSISQSGYTWQRLHQYSNGRATIEWWYKTAVDGSTTQCTINLSGSPTDTYIQVNYIYAVNQPRLSKRINTADSLTSGNTTTFPAHSNVEPGPFTRIGVMIIQRSISLSPQVAVTAPYSGDTSIVFSGSRYKMFTHGGTASPSFIYENVLFYEQFSTTTTQSITSGTVDYYNKAVNGVVVPSTNTWASSILIPNTQNQTGTML
jgi:hypothetical protein